MSNAALSVIAEEKLVTITIDHSDESVQFDPDVLHIPYGFNGVITWVIEHLDAKFKQPPIIFNDVKLVVPASTTAKLAQMPWVNHNNSGEAQQYAYTANLVDGFERLKPDPTVENDPPGYFREAQSRA